MSLAGLLNGLQHNTRRADKRGHAALGILFTVTAAQRTKQQVMQLCTQNTRVAPKQVESLRWQSGHNSPSS